MSATGTILSLGIAGAKSTDFIPSSFTAGGVPTAMLGPGAHLWLLLHGCQISTAASTDQGDYIVLQDVEAQSYRADSGQSPSS